MNLLWQSALLLFFAFLLEKLLLRSARPVTLKNYWLACLVLAPIIPFITQVGAMAGAPVSPLVENNASRNVAFETPLLEATRQRNRNLITPSSYYEELEEKVRAEELETASKLPVFSMIYGGGVSLLLLSFGGGLLRLRWLSRKARPVTDSRVLGAFEMAQSAVDPRSPCFVMFVPGLSSPCSLGILNFRILLPPDLSERFEEVEIRDLALHEMAHIRHRDPLNIAIAAIITSLLFLNPLAWVASRRFRFFCEQNADFCVLETTEEVKSYAGFLVRLAGGEETGDVQMPQGAAAGLMGLQSQFVRRAESILNWNSGDMSRLKSRHFFAMVSLGSASILSALFPFFGRVENERLDPEEILKTWLFESTSREDDGQSSSSATMNVSGPIEITEGWNTQNAVGLAKSTWFTFVDADDQEFTVCLDRELESKTAGQWFEGGISPEEDGVRVISAGSAEEFRLKNLLFEWVARHFTRRQWEELVLEANWNTDSNPQLFALMIDETFDTSRRLRRARTTVSEG